MPGRRRARLVVVLTLVALLGTSAFLVYRRVMRAVGAAAPMLASRLETELHRKVTIGAVDYRTPGVLHLRRVRIGGRRPGVPLAEIEAVVIRYRWDALLRGTRDPVALVGRIELFQPR